MTQTLKDIFNLSILLAALISITRVRVIEKAYVPFFILLWLAAINEILSVILMQTRHNTIVNNNIYVLLESLLILLFFKKTMQNLKREVFLLLFISIVAVWILENLVFGKIDNIGVYFRIYYSFVVVILSIDHINYLLFNEKGSLMKSPSFLISICFIIFFTYKIIVEAFWIKGLNNSPEFRNSVYTLMVYLNLAVNLVFALVTLWIPRKQPRLLWS